MKELIELVYTKLFVQINNDNERLLSKVLTKYINDNKIELNALIILTELPEFHNLYNPNIIDCLSSFYGMNKNKAIICKENPNTIFL